MPPGDYIDAKGRPLPSVSEIISQMRSSYRSAAIEEAALLGSVAHRLIERSILGEQIDLDSVPQAARQSFSAFQAWRFMRDPALYQVETDGLPSPASELRITCDEFGGCLDLVVIVSGRLVVVDLKTRTAAENGKLPTPDRHVWAQLGGYAHLWEGAGYPRLDGALALMLGRNEPTYRECWLDRTGLEDSIEEFRHLLGAYRAHQRRKAIIRETRD